MRVDPSRRGSLGTRVWWRQVTSDCWAVVVMVAIVTITVLVVAAAPRAVEFASSRDLAAAIEQATPEERNVTFEMRTEIGAGPPRSPFLNVVLEGEQLREEHVPEPVAELFGETQWVVDTPQFVVSSFPGDETGPFPTTFKFRSQEGIEDRWDLVGGSAPEAQDPIVRLEGSECPDDVDEIDPDEFEPDPDVECGVVELPLFETVISRQTAEDMMLDVGDQVTLRPSLTDLSFRTVRVDAGSIRFVLRISGIAEFADPTLDYWYADTSLHRPRITENPDFRLIFATGLLSPDQYRPFRDAAPGVTMNFAWRNLVDPERIQAADAIELRSDVDKIAPPDADVVTLLPELLGDHLAQRRLAVALSSVAATGVAVGALGAVWVLAGVDGVRRRTVTRLLADRGASRAHLRLHALRTAALVTIPAVVVGSAVAALCFPGTAGTAAVVPIAVVTVLAAVGFLVTATVPNDETDRSVFGGRRVVIEATIAIVAVGSVILLRRRSTSVTDVLDDGVDPLLAVAPVAVALFAAVVVMRTVGPVARRLDGAARRRRDVGWFIGLRRLADQAPAARAPIAVVAFACAMAVLAIVVSMSLDRSRDLAAWQLVGGDVRVDSQNPDIPLPPRLQDAVRARSDAVAFGSALQFQRFEGQAGSFVSDVVALDLDAFAELVPAEILDDAVDVPLEVAGDDGALRALFVGSRAAFPDVGDAVQLESGAYVVPFRLVGASERFPGVSTDRPVIVVDRHLLEAATDARTVEPTFAVADRFELDGELAALLDEPGVLVKWTDRIERRASFSGDPLSVWVERFMVLLGSASLVIALVTSAGATVISTVARRRDVGVLTVLGLGHREGVRLVAVELVPALVAAAAVGTAAGASIGWLIGDNLGLDTFAAGNVGVVVVSWPAVIATAAVIVCAAVVVVAATIRSVNRVDHAMLLRKGEN